MKFKSQVITQASGSIGGTTFAHNRGGLYMRARSIPTDPASTQQVAVRNIFASLVTSWTSVLTPVERDAWTVYATNTPIVDKLGDPLTLTGQQMFIRSMTPRLQAGLALITDAPTIFSLGDFGPISFAASATPNEILVLFTDTDTWVDEDDSSMLVFASRPQNPSINYFKGPYRLAGSIDGNSTTPPTTPASIPAPFPFVVGNKIFAAVSVTRADGRLSTKFRGGNIAI